MRFIKRLIDTVPLALVGLAMWLLAICLVTIVIAEQDQSQSALRAELRDLQLEHVRLIRESCEVTEGGPRVLCAMRDGWVLRQELDDHDVIVRARLKKSTKRRR